MQKHMTEEKNRTVFSQILRGFFFSMILIVIISLAFFSTSIFQLFKSTKTYNKTICQKNGGTWKQGLDCGEVFSECVYRRSMILYEEKYINTFVYNPGLGCSNTEKCFCGAGKCWNGSRCEIIWDEQKVNNYLQEIRSILNP